MYSFYSRVSSPIQLDEHTVKLKKRCPLHGFVENPLSEVYRAGLLIGVTGKEFWFPNPCLCLTCGNKYRLYKMI